MTGRVAIAMFSHAALLAGAGCAHRTAPVPVAGPPTLSRIVPDSVAIVAGNVTEVELRGTGFDASREAPANTVRIGRLELTNVRASADGGTIRITIPDGLPSGGEAPPRAWSSGRYPVVVRTARGASDTVFLKISVGRGVAP